jgi:ABC-type lipoprotein export system ATPase subunit
MIRRFRWFVGKLCFLSLLFSLVASFSWAQSETATVSGQVVDPSGLNITGAQVRLVDIDRDTSITVTTNNLALYTFPSVRPGRYRMAVTAVGFKVVNVTGLTVNVQDHLEQNFKLVVGSVSESITVEGGAPIVNTESAAVSTIVDRKYVENMPLNGRSLQNLILLTPGVVTNSPQDGAVAGTSGEFSVNGQRTESNYYTVDGVSANLGISAGVAAAPGTSGSLPSPTALGTTQGLVSLDALEEFRVQSSTYSAEYGRNPGGQFSFVTRSGTNEWHGVAFDYLRNNDFDANDWFNNYYGEPQPTERQNDFGATLGGPVVFPSLYEGKDKSTLMNLLGCLDTPSSGIYKFRDAHVERLSRDQRALLRRNFLGFVFQGFNLLARTTALENVELPLQYRRQPSSERRRAARQALASVGLTGWETHTPAELSGGQQQRVAIARALVTRPLVLFADEPTGNLDTQCGREIMELIGSLNRDRGITVLVVTHDPLIAAYAARIVRIVDGHIESDTRTGTRRR